ncbi:MULTISPECIES: trehalose-phosphatase [unclassified Sphingomonas]|jgi:trehalose 6-phosphate phosphatase|uniref:trehalose-phosphatase n=1 Tax=unclassified Sphingomonas TaxID=196159 RepID=UPI000E0FFE5C|nr:MULTISPECIES: trehalose-phosphatase [unclassified Sphingomonas]AXJ94453.1 trehalose-phosphatase [Sphingomonas sp. FARSPH]
MMLPPPPPDLLRDAALFLDFDGTLVELQDRPDAVRVDARLAALIDTLSHALDGRVAIISGRSVSGIRALFGDPSFAISGSHGLEVVWPDGRETVAERPAALDRIVAEMTSFASTRPGVLVEQKPLGAALHYRKDPAAAAGSDALARTLADQAGLHLQTGKMMVEVRVPGADKGSALCKLMETGPMAGYRPVFLGDDDTDEPAMVAAARLGGAGILIGAARASAAAYRLDGVSAALDWLEAAARKAGA